MLKPNTTIHKPSHALKNSELRTLAWQDPYEASPPSSQEGATMPQPGPMPSRHLACIGISSEPRAVKSG